MKTLIIYCSTHHNNTEKVAKAMASVLGAELKNPVIVDMKGMKNYDLIGFGSGIYFGKHHKTLLQIVDLMESYKGKAFVFSTRGGGPIWPLHRALKRRLDKKGYKIIGEFSCKGFDTYGPLKLFGGINKARPNEKDLERAKDFAKALKEK